MFKPGQLHAHGSSKHFHKRAAHFNHRHAAWQNARGGYHQPASKLCDHDLNPLYCRPCTDKRS